LRYWKSIVEGSRAKTNPKNSLNPALREFLELRNYRVESD